MVDENDKVISVDILEKFKFSTKDPKISLEEIHDHIKNWQKKN
jgi:hypothetical protein